MKEEIDIHKPKWKIIGLRLFAYFLDCLILFLVFVGLVHFGTYLVLGKLPYQYVEESWTWYRSLLMGAQMWLIILVTISLPTWIYFIFCEYLNPHATIGKKILQLKVYAINRPQISIWQAIGITFVRLLPWECTHFVLFQLVSDSILSSTLLIAANIIIVVYILTPILNHQEYTLHDLLSKTTTKKINLSKGG